jgi:hypothetical protein
MQVNLQASSWDSIPHFEYPIIYSSILKDIPWSKEMTKWAQSSASDPSLSNEAIQDRIKTIREIMSRPDDPPSTGSSQRFGKPVLDEDSTDSSDVSLSEIQSDLRRWWKNDEEARFYERLADYKVKIGDDIVDADIYNFWIDEWASRAKNIVKF